LTALLNLAIGVSSFPCFFSSLCVSEPEAGRLLFCPTGASVSYSILEANEYCVFNPLM